MAERCEQPHTRVIFWRLMVAGATLAIASSSAPASGASAMSCHRDHRRGGVEFADELRYLTEGRRRLAMTTVRTGGCLCGAVRYESAGEPLFSLLCHCRDCQHQSGSAYVAAMRVPAAGFRLTKGEPKLYVSSSDAGNRVTRAFCPSAAVRCSSASRPDRRSSAFGSAASTTPAGFAPRSISSSKARSPGTT